MKEETVDKLQVGLSVLNVVYLIFMLMYLFNASKCDQYMSDKDKNLRQVMIIVSVIQLALIGFGMGAKETLSPASGVVILGLNVAYLAFMLIYLLDAKKCDVYMSNRDKNFRKAAVVITIIQLSLVGLAVGGLGVAYYKNRVGSHESDDD